MISIDRNVYSVQGKGVLLTVHIGETAMGAAVCCCRCCSCG